MIVLHRHALDIILTGQIKVLQIHFMTIYVDRNCNMLHKCVCTYVNLKLIFFYFKENDKNLWDFLVIVSCIL